MSYQQNININGYIVKSERYTKIKSEVYKVLKKELPNEGQTVEVLSGILSNLDEDLKREKVDLSSFDTSY